MPECCSTTRRGPLPTAEAVKTALICPRCDQSGQPVPTRTIKHQVKPEFLTAVEDGSFNFCRGATCDAVYFNGRGLVLTKADVHQRIGLKETKDPVPICYCFGFTERMVVEELRTTGDCSIPQRIAAEVKAGNCACEVRNPQDSCCLGNVTAAVKRLRAAEEANRGRK